MNTYKITEAIREHCKNALKITVRCAVCGAPPQKPCMNSQGIRAPHLTRQLAQMQVKP